MEPLPRLVAMLERCVEEGASDLHLSVDRPPLFRLHGRLEEAGFEPFSSEQFEALAEALMNPRQRQHFAVQMTIDLGFTSDGERFRLNLFRERGRIALAVRHLANEFFSFENLHLPPQLRRLAALQSGLVIVSGATGSGKSTTLAALVDEINRTRRDHVITIEDPIEFVYEDAKSLIHQRELHTDVTDFASAVRASLREDPDVILVGEMRDLETMRAALTAAETGHLVFTTLHTGDAVGVVERLVGSFPADEQAVVRHRAALSLKAVVAQHLLRTADGRGRVPAVELLLVNRAVANLIDSAKPRQIYSTMEASRAEGMQTLDQSLAGLVRERWITQEAAAACAQDTIAFEELAGRETARTPAGRSALR